MGSIAAVYLMLAGSVYGDTHGQAALNGVRKAYSGLRAFHAITATSQSICTGFANAQSADVESELAEKPGGKFRARYKSNDQSFEVSNGSKTWKALPKVKRWSQTEAVGVNSESNDSDDAVKPAQDLHSNPKDTLLLRYPALVRFATDPVGGELG